MNAVRPVWLALVAVALYAASGVYVVAPDERGVVRAFGRVSGPHLPGVHVTWPAPFARVDKPATSEVRRRVVAFTDADEARMDGVLTSDSHVLDVVAAAQYQVVDAVDFVLAARDVDALVDHALRAAIVESVGALDVDAALTTGRAAVALDVQRRAQRTLDDAGCGVLVATVTVERLEAPATVRPAFQDVVGARQDAERRVDDARSAAAAAIAAAEGEAARVVESSHGRAARATAEARSAADRFVTLLAEHRRAPEAFERRAILDTLEAVVPRLRTYILGDGAPPPRLLEPRDG